MSNSQNRKIEPFPFDELPQFSEEEVRSILLLARIFPGTGLQSDFLDKITEALKSHLGADAKLIYESTYFHQGEKVRLTLPKNFAGFIMSLSKDYLPLFFYFENHLSLSLVDRMLGGSGSVMDQSRSLSALEEGVMQYFVITLMKEFSRILPEKFSLKFNQMCSYPEDVDAYWKMSAGFHVMNFRLELKMIQGFLKLYIPQNLVLQLNQDYPQFMNQSDQVTHYLKKRLLNFSHLKSVVWAEVGEVTLSQEELNQITEGDIILFDKSYPSLTDGELRGDVYLRLGLGHALGIKSQLRSSSKEKFEFLWGDSFLETDEVEI